MGCQEFSHAPAMAEFGVSVRQMGGGFEAIPTNKSDRQRSTNCYVCTMEQLSLRLANLADKQAVSRVSRRAYEPAYMSLIGTLPQPATEDYEPWIREELVWVCEASSHIAGALTIQKHADFWMIWSIAVEPAQQGQGIGMWLIEQAKNMACMNGIYTLRLHTNSKMTGNLSLYRKAGFYQTDIIPHPSRLGHELVYMQFDAEVPNGS